MVDGASLSAHLIYTSLHTNI